MKHLLLAATITLAPTIAFSQGSYLDIMGIIRGDNLGSQFGKKVVPAGDVNGDTIPDFLVLAAGDQKVYLFHGKKGGLDTLPDLVFEHKTQLELLGDINGDSQLDFGMRETGQNYRISLYFGGGILDTIRDGYIKGDSSGAFPFDLYGRYVSAGKISDSGDYQIVVGDPAYDNRGRFYAYSGRLGCYDSVPFWRVIQGAPFQGGGPGIVLGDVNVDGYSDIASNGNNDEVAIYLGKSVLDTLPDLILRGSTTFGEKVAPVGDLNGDGLSDFVIGISRIPLLYFGSSPLDTLPQFTLDRVGDHFVNGGDINGDGYNDLLVGRDEADVLTGFAYIYYGGTAMDSVRDLQIIENDLPEAAPGFGRTVAGLGDIDGDGANDFAIGSESVQLPDRGLLWVFNGLLPSTDVDDEKTPLPKNFTLDQNYPNPFNPTTVISFALPNAEKVRLKIYNILGQEVATLVDEEKPAGTHQLIWDGTDSRGAPVSSGIYFYKIETPSFREVKRMVFVK